ncbi:protein retinal degeneration B isoform X1 [Diorhabda sublineata]|uniref:protein retinal degeneration B isoform X1 n=1 Tax=Diorhabda sublineata TaxID=1163346 RepID=UPI0024E181B2|nr:protein retinal degeneration B isoform X1 [Diorhabda sublineata]XP_056630467.1 protein retinal degeneration B isoform X1 [Diorhabda sublineata]XP_056630468.1 protein retinal degeneration B isoform X1 [Diorhabda sublineata]XP_056630469.1 protein retinal degeneration B isoform X1 [Diorhabda sublineata]XP_056630470.1 protein retinal degeneration B isoform X1 [Diorhabda sublineata]XP_056630471.1 protein retinal degeneration B isoform X1 [Diorhabda sublineata]XP_056630472.1 protein retinal dege
MLIKEYRIPLPLTVEEYRIAQLYMIAKKSREESSGAGSGVEILINEPYTHGPGGQGQYTKKIYHVGSHLPGWIKGILPKTALMVEEEAWNAYPYTKTRYTCPFVEKFSLEIETYYYPDNGHQENVFELSGSDLRNRIVDVIDVVKDQLYGADYVKEEDPLYYVSEKSGRGPLSTNWLEEYWDSVKGKQQPSTNGKSLMCAYKLCKVEFRYWGMQTKIERFIHDTALRKTMLRAHRQAWAWQDEWHGLTMEDIREIERQTQLALRRKMGQLEDEIDEDDHVGNSTSKEDPGKTLAATLGSIEVAEDSPLMAKNSNIPAIQTAGSSDTDLSPEDDMGIMKREDKWQQSRTLHSPSSSSIKSFDLQVANWRIKSLGRDSGSSSDEEFFDCEDSSSLAKWSSLELLMEEDQDTTSPINHVSQQDVEDSIFSPTYLQRVASERGNRRAMLRGKINSVEASCPESPLASPAHNPCKTTVLILVLHAGSVLDANVDLTAKKSDITTFKGAFELVMRQHYPSLIAHVAIRLVSCPSICTEGLGILSSLSPYSFDVSPSCTDVPQITHDSIPIGAIPILASSTSEYAEAVSRTISAANTAYQEFIKSEEGQGFAGQVCFVADSMGSILGYDALSRTTKYASRHGSENSILDSDLQKLDEVHINESGHLTAPTPRRRSSSTSDQQGQIKLEFEVSDFFMFGSPLALVLAYRKISSPDDKLNNITRPVCLQVYNLFHPTDPVAARLEPLLSARFSILAPVNIPRYAKYPLGNGQPYHLVEILQSNPQMFNDNIQPRRLSEVSIQSTVSGLIDIPFQAINALQQKWWGSKRMDYALYCPEGLSNFPTNALPHLFHASYWESCDVIAFILRQIGGIEVTSLPGDNDREQSFRPGQPREKWIRKRTSVKLKNVTANHRANDVIVREGAAQTLTARFMYGPLDMITLTGEKVDIHVMKDAPLGEWSHFATEVTDKTGRITFTIPEEKSLSYGLYPIKMVVRGDHTAVDFFLAVVPPKTECIVFSIDGSFTASVSVTGRDPKVRAGAVDVVRHWQELGFLIIYITGRPDMQHRRVVSWLSQHNFPHGLISFADGLSTDPLGHKAAYLNNLVENHGVVIHSAYGSAKDINVYTSVGLKQKQIFIIGKATKKQQSQATILTDGYAAHLTMLMSHGGSRPAQGNARMVIPRGHFGLPGQTFSRRRSRSAKRATSYPIAPDSTQPMERSLSTRRYQLPKPMLSISLIGK